MIKIDTISITLIIVSILILTGKRILIYVNKILRKLQ